MIFIENKYHRTYFSIIAKAQARTENPGYTENHHIIPKSLGGTNDKDNLVVLTAREHFVCHWLLTKMVSGKKHLYQMWNALSAMLYWNRDGISREKITSRKFQLLKEQISKQKSIKFSGSGNAMFGKTHSIEAKRKMSNAHIGRVVSKETREKLRNRDYNNTWSSAVMKANNPNNIPGVRDKMKATFREKYGVDNCCQIPKTCEHCGKSVGVANYSRWHGKNCKALKS